MVTAPITPAPLMISIRRVLVPAILAALLPGCADSPAVPPKIDRISAEQLEARLPQPAAALPLEQVVALARQGIAAEALIARITASASRYRLSAAQIIDLARQGVPPAVLDHIVAAERRQIFDDMAAEANRRETDCREQVEREASLCRNPPLGPMFMPAPGPMINCFPLSPGSPFWRCL